jgi:feruloyl-CoA synthase
MSATDLAAADLAARRAPFRRTYFPPADMRVERRADGTLVIEPVAELAPFVPNFPAQLAERARLDPGRLCIAERSGPGGPWVRHGYGEFKRAADAVTQWLLGKSLAADRSLLILSGNSVPWRPACPSAPSVPITR